MKKLFVSLILAVLTASAFTQPVVIQNNKFTYRNSVQFELFGHGLIYSLNYECVLINRNRLKTTAQIGFSYYPPAAGYREIWIPVGINEMISFNKHHIEIGIGQVLTNERPIRDFTGTYHREWDGFFSGRIGYRYQKPNGRLIIRAGFTPFLEYLEQIAFHPSGALTVGYCF
ncbi:MAG: hypothetical protein WC865_14760 [Bacteroidales bacterium]